MKKLIAFSSAVLFAVVANASEFEQKRERTLADKSINENVKKELRTYFEKKEVVYKECKAKHDELKNKLSPDAKDALKKHFKRKRDAAQQPTTPQQPAAEQQPAKKS